jgi:NAD+ synthase (glutamine-hydrolysing)
VETTSVGRGCIIGLSGGIDSALVAYLATVALGKDQVIGVGMPSEFSSEGSITDAEMIAKKLGIRFLLEPIKSQHNEFRNAVDNMLMQNGESTMVPSCSESGVTDENLQARTRGVLLMALANYYNGIVLSTGNKSEMAVGYCTLYGDMCGGLASISDVYKTQIFDICKYINKTLKDEIIPWNTINKPPSAELRKDQKDSDSLPPYETLDAILFKYVDEAKSPKQIAKEMLTLDAEIKYEKATGRNLKNDIVWTCNAVIRNEFKRKQSPTGLKVSQKLFKYGWTQPIVHKLKTVI